MTEIPHVLNSITNRIKERVENIISVEVSKEEYFSKLDQTDRKNIELILNDLSSSEENTGGLLAAIGSSVREKEGWRDLDLRIFANKGSSIDEIIKKFKEAIERLKDKFEVKEGKVSTEKLDELRDCLYLIPREGGKIIHVLLPDPMLDALTQDELFTIKLQEENIVSLVNSNLAGRNTN